MSARHLHFVGIGGVGMCGLAEVLLREGVMVSGCDLSDSERTHRLRGLGVTVHLGHDPEHLRGVDAVVVSAAVPPDEPELTEAARAGVSVVRRSELLGELMRRRRGIAVAGTHGKTTTTALIGHLLAETGLDPLVLVGGRARSLEAHARLGAGEIMVCEADEYDRAFLELGPELAVITNVEPEHLDTYGLPIELERAFVTFANRASVFGAVVLCADDPGARSLASRIRRRRVTYGLAADAGLRAEIRTADVDGTRFAVLSGSRALGEVTVPMAGRHNVSNALAAVAVGLEMGVGFDELAAACATFSGVARRFERRGERDGVVVVDDYAHHPTEVRAALEAAHQALPERRLVAVFQPHLYSRTAEFAAEFGAALSDAGVVVLLPVYPAREAPIPGVGSHLIAAEVRRRGRARIVESTQEEVVALLDELLEDGDVLLTLGAGDVDRVGAAWLGGRS